MNDFLKKHSRLVDQAENFLAMNQIPVAIHDFRNARFYETYHTAEDGHSYVVILAVNDNGLHGIVSEPLDLDYHREQAGNPDYSYEMLYRTKIRAKYTYGKDEKIQRDIAAVFAKGVEIHNNTEFLDAVPHFKTY